MLPSINQFVKIIFYNEPVHHPVFVLIHSTFKIICNPYVKDVIRLVCKDIHILLFFHGLSMMLRS
jgi:hypothetical protein